MLKKLRGPATPEWKAVMYNHGKVRQAIEDGQSVWSKAVPLGTCCLLPLSPSLRVDFSLIAQEEITGAQTGQKRRDREGREYCCGMDTQASGLARTRTGSAQSGGDLCSLVRTEGQGESRPDGGSMSLCGLLD